MIKKTLTVDSDKRVFCVGDIHGEITKLSKKLELIGFSKERDILISVGDLIDRGENSLACLSLIKEPWFHAVRGNHEDLMIESIINKSEPHILCWIGNGSQWYFGLNQEDRAHADDLAKMADSELPYVIELNYKGKKIVICHADYPNSDYTGDIDIADLYDIVWSRSRINGVMKGVDDTNIKGADLFIFGHTPLREPLSIGNCKWIDTGAVFGKELTIIEID